MPPSLERVFFIPDCHHPYADPKAWALCLKAIRKFKPHTLVVLGDFADFYSVSSHDKDPRRVRSLSEEVGAVNERLDELDAIKGIKRKIFVCGNHENRLERYLMTRAPELFDTVTIKGLLQLKDRGWEYVPYRQFGKVGKLHVTHDVGHAGVSALRQSQAAFETNVVIGHTHRIGYMVRGNVQGKPHVAAMFGWLGASKAADYMHAAKANRDWAHGFGIGYKERNGTVHVQPIPIVKGKAVIAGEVIQ